MQQPEDTKTLNLLEDVKRGRGRPPKPDALTGAERAKKFRDARRAGIPPTRGSTVTKNIDEVTENIYAEKDAEIARLKKELKELESIEQHRSRSLMLAHNEIKIYTQKIVEQEENLALETQKRAKVEAKLKTMQSALRKKVKAAE